MRPGSRQLNPRQKLSVIELCAAIIIVLAIGLAFHFTTAYADVTPASSLCGNGSAPDYGFTYDLRQAHWTVGWQSYTSEQSVTEVDTVLDKLNADYIAQTMILILPAEKVGNRVNCAVHFLRYMQLGQPDGERKDNGFVFLIVLDPGKIDVHYGVGLGLPALTASELTNLNRSAEDTYKATGSLDRALVSLVKDFDTVARSNYSPLIIASPTSEPTSEPYTLPTSEMSISTLCCLACVGIVVLLIFIWILSQLARRGITFEPHDSGSWGGSSGPFGGGGGGWGGPPMGGGGSSSPSRGGSGSGRSGRGN